MLGSFFGHSEISILNPQTKYFYKNVNMEFSKMAIFGENHHMDMSYIMDSG